MGDCHTFIHAFMSAKISSYNVTQHATETDRPRKHSLAGRRIDAHLSNFIPETAQPLFLPSPFITNADKTL